ncbi:MAG: helix-turn-helix transcriptional regulator [Syntrophobacteraceae bacterium]
MCLKTVKLLLVSDDSARVGTITDSLSGCSLLSLKIEIAANAASGLRKMGREIFDICLVDNSLTETEANYFLAKMADEHRDTALVIVDASGNGHSPSAFESPVDGRISLCARPSIECRLLAALLTCKEREVNCKTLLTEELNTALKVVTQTVGKDVFEIEERMQMNLKLLVFPYLEQLKNTRLQKGQKWLLEILESNIRKIFSPFLKNLLAQSPQLSYAESRVADLIKEGKSSKEIATMLGVSEKTVLTHRFHIRTKLGIKNKDVSLMSHLMSLQ